MEMLWRKHQRVLSINRFSYFRDCYDTVKTREHNLHKHCKSKEDDGRWVASGAQGWRTVQGPSGQQTGNRLLVSHQCLLVIPEPLIILTFRISILIKIWNSLPQTLCMQMLTDVHMLLWYERLSLTYCPLSSLGNVIAFIVLQGADVDIGGNLFYCLQNILAFVRLVIIPMLAAAASDCRVSDMDLDNNNGKWEWMKLNLHAAGGYLDDRPEALDWNL